MLGNPNQVHVSIFPHKVKSGLNPTPKLNAQVPPWKGKCEQKEEGKRCFVMNFWLFPNCNTEAKHQEHQQLGQVTREPPAFFQD